jgi:hypothetical protein
MTVNVKNPLPEICSPWDDFFKEGFNAVDVLPLVYCAWVIG